MCSPDRARHYAHEHGMGGEAPFVRKRHGGPFGQWGFGGPGGPFGGGPGPRGRGRRRRGDVRIAMLLLLAEEPSNGYKLMQTLEERSDGRWRPSPGSVYPALAQLEDEGFVKQVETDSGKAYEITDAGREHLAERGDQKAPWEEEDEDEITDGHKAFGKVLVSTAKAAAQVAREGDEQQIAKATALLTEARRGLYRLLAEEPDAEE
jgi:DNA-binding PadR family transcriptional regulator